jgi:drug/metabolite transporter (DMT)-like permease
MNQYLGDILSILTACVWSTAVILFKISGHHLPPGPLKVFQNTISVVLFSALLIVLGEPLTLDLDGATWARVIASAILGITLGDTFYLAAINRLGAGFQALVDGLYSPTVMLLAYLILGESVSAQILLGASFVLFAIVLAHFDSASEQIPRRTMWIGILYAALSQVGMASCVVMVRDLLRIHSLYTLTAYRFLFGTVILILFYLLNGAGRELWAGFRPSRRWKVLLPGAVLGPFLATLLWFAGFKYTTAARAAVYNQLSTVLILLLASFFLNERLTPRRLWALGISVVGGYLVFRAS